MSKITVGYWDIRGLAEPARMMLEYGGLDYEDKRYVVGEAPGFDLSQWLSVKFKLGLDFPNLPYLMDCDAKMTESWAIFRHVGRKVGLIPKTEKESYEADMLEGVISTFRGAFTGACYNPDFENLKAGLRESQPKKLKMFNDFLEGRKFIVGERLTYVDFALFETLDHHRLMFPDILNDFPNVQGFMKRFESLDQIAAYFKSDRYKKFPINNKMAKWGNKAL